MSLAGDSPTAHGTPRRGSRSLRRTQLCWDKLRRRFSAPTRNLRFFCSRPSDESLLICRWSVRHNGGCTMRSPAPSVCEPVAFEGQDVTLRGEAPQGRLGHLRSLTLV